MEPRPLGATGLTVSALGFGCGAVGGLMVRGDASEQRQAVSRALEAGITYFDTAAQYGDGRSEENLGRVMRELGAWSRVVVGTKVRLRAEEMGDLAGAIRASLEASLKRLGRSDVDVFVFDPDGKEVAKDESVGPDGFVTFFQTGRAPVSAEETIEMFTFMEAADESKRQRGAPLAMEQVLAKARKAVAEKAGR